MHGAGREGEQGTSVADDPLALLTVAGAWRLWPVAGLRSAGLAAERVLELGGTDDGDGLAPADDVARAVERFALDPWCREAVTWQAPALVENWLGDYARRLRLGDGSLPRRARKEATVALYLQRYATKNDTIGFFGPVMWARLCPDRPAGVTLGPEVELRRRTHLEAWAVETLARGWEADPDLRPFLPARLDPSGRLAGRRMTFPRRPAADLSADEAAVAALCAAPVSAADLLPRVRAAHPELGFGRVAEVVSVLARLQRLGCVVWGFHLPLDERMDEHLLAQVEAVPDAGVRERHAQPLRRLRASAREVEAASGDPERLLAALGALEREYEAASGAASRRTKAESGTARALVWQDVLRTREAVIGGGVLEPLWPSLELVLDTCRWLTWNVARGVAAAAASVVAASGAAALPLGRVLVELTPELRGEPGTTRDRVVREMQARAAAILLPAAGQRADLALEEVRDRWAEAFAAPGPGWAAARLHSPDLMLAAAGPAEVERGAFRWVLGEVHVAVDTLENRCFVVNQEHEGAIERLTAASLPGVRYVPAFPRGWPDLSVRAYPPLSVDLPDRYVHWSIEPVDTLPAGTPRLPAADLDVVAPAGGEPVVVSRTDRSFRAPLVEVIGELLSFLAGNAFTLLPARPHTPRVTVDRLVLRRESWSLPLDALLARGSRVAGQVPDEEALAALLRERGIPRFTFARAPGEPKPILCDLRSAPLLRALARSLRRSEAPDAAVRFEEMLPGFGDLWLRDAGGQGHTSELRVVAVDWSGRAPSPRWTPDTDCDGSGG